ncbi:hypothetical protein A2335_01180 [Candidatus Peregrinibacteria bacterium RIFOXYB2_FULL_32_7]|nr:MAG: hypothetical protein A2335_01180 [Candidatus Peregrinibacteria bacterium RIFOXYB2_FULL_32_7]
MNAILVSNDNIFRNRIKEKLKTEDINIISITDISKLPIQLLYKNADLILIDSVLNKSDIYEIHLILQHYPELKVLILHRNTQKSTKKTFEFNYCYLIPYFHFGEISFLIDWIRHENKTKYQKDILQFQTIILNRKRHTLTINNEFVNLRKREFKLLEFFMTHPEIVLPRQQIITNVWERERFVLSNTIDTHINNLRRKIELPGASKVLHTIRGVGYRFGAE